jgi:hypothetical protein
MPDDRVDNRGELDRLLDSALATYADPGPNSGLERRILNRLAVEATPAPRPRWLPWAIALPAAVALLLFILLSGTRPFHAPSSAPPQAHSSSPPSPNSSRHAAENPGKDLYESSNRHAAEEPGKVLYQGTTSVVPKKQSRERGALAPAATPRPKRAVLAANSAPLPKLDVFPTPQPLSPEEQALVNFAARASKSEREALIAAQQQDDAPLRIAAIEIQPLEPPASGAH